MRAATEARQPAQSWELPARWRELGLALLKGRNIDPDLYQNKTVKERLMDALAVPNVLALVENARELDDVDEDEVWARLGLDRGTPNRWIREAVQPHGRMFFGTLVLGLRREIDEVLLPRNRTLIWESVSRTVAIIREKELGRDRRRPRPEEFACVRCLMRLPLADRLAPRRKGEDAPAPELVDEVLTRVLEETKLASASAVRAVIKEWAEPYVLFRLGLLWEWRSLDEDAV